MLFDALDPHGHVIDLGTLTCDACREAVRSDGYCDACGMGFVDEQAYFTRLSHGLAQGHAVRLSDIDCGGCRAAARDAPRWCDRCDRGMIGSVSISSRAVFDRTKSEFDVLDAAIQRTAACELCACAMVVHSTCPVCWISYEVGGETPESIPQRNIIN